MPLMQHLWLIGAHLINCKRQAARSTSKYPGGKQRQDNSVCSTSDIDTPTDDKQQSTCHTFVKLALFPTLCVDSSVIVMWTGVSPDVPSFKICHQSGATSSCPVYLEWCAHVLYTQCKCLDDIQMDFTDRGPGFHQKKTRNQYSSVSVSNIRFPMFRTEKRFSVESPTI